MNERARTSGKTEETRRMKPRKPDDPQAIRSPSDHILSLQRSIGNQAVGRLIRGLLGGKVVDDGRVTGRDAASPGASSAPSMPDASGHESSPAAMGQESLKSWRATSALWYFNGEPHKEPLPTQVTLQAEAKPSGTFLWSVAQGNDKAELVGGGGDGTHAIRTDDNRVGIKSKAGSHGTDDVNVRVSHVAADGTPTGTYEGNLGVRTPVGTRKVQEQTTRITPSSSAAAYPVPVEGEGGGAPPVEEEGEASPRSAASAAPKSLSPKGSTHSADPSEYYKSLITYEVMDDKGKAIKGFDVNEQWSTGVVNDDKTCNWPRGKPGGLTSTTTQFADRIGAVIGAGVPTPTAPGSPLGTTKVQHWGQDWYIGSTTPGKGTQVQSNTLQKYLDHGAHENIKSPP